MSEHVVIWLDAYYDGELSPERRRRVGAHLEHCARCRAEWEALQSLSVWLQSDAEVELPGDSADFAARVREHLPARPRLRQRESEQPTAWTRDVRLGWWLVPVALLAVVTWLEIVFSLGRWLLAALPVVNVLAEVGVPLHGVEAPGFWSNLAYSGQWVWLQVIIWLGLAGLASSWLAGTWAWARHVRASH